MIRILILLTVGISVMITTVVAGPSIEILEDSFNFGRAAQHAVLSHRFRIANTGDETLIITKVDPGCGCTKTPLADSSLAPGEETILELFFSTKSFRGIVSKKAIIQTNIGEGRYYIKFQSELLPQPDTIQPIHLSPSRLDISQFKKKVRRKAKFWIHNTDSVDYKLKLIYHADKVFDVKMPDVVLAHDSAWGGITIKDEAIAGPFEHSITIELDDGSGIRYSLPIKRLYRVTE